MSDETVRIDDGGPAFPLPFVLDSTRGVNGQYVDAEDAGVRAGLTLRDYFAAKAMQAIISKHPPGEGTVADQLDIACNVARGSFVYADAMLAARKAGGK